MTTDTQDNAAFSPQDASIDDITIVTVNGNYNVRKLVVELSYFEDLYSFVISGYVILRDGRGLIEKLQLSGKEHIDLAFGKTKNGSNAVKKRFRLYSIPERKPVGNLSSEFIKLHFCSEELLTSESIKVTQSYKGKAVSEIIYDILNNKMKIDPMRINIEQTFGMYDFIVPVLKPFEAISWLSTYARPNRNNKIGADMLFYETKDGFKFSSLSTLYTNPIKNTYRYDQKNTQQSFDKKVTSVLDYEFVRAFDSLRDIHAGTFANRLITLDPLNRTFLVTDWDYNDYKGLTLNPNDAAPDFYTKDGEKISDKHEALLKLAISNANQQRKDTFSGYNVAPDIFLETTVPNRTAQLSLANYTVIKLRIPGDTSLTAGDTIQFNLLSLDGSQGKGLDEYYSGKYLITSVRHVIQSQGIFQTILEITKDSSIAPYKEPKSLNIG